MYRVLAFGIALGTFPIVAEAEDELFSIDELTEAAVEKPSSGKPAGKKRRPPAKLSRPEIMRAMVGKRAVVEQRCGADLSETTAAEVVVDVAPEGTVSNVTVNGPLADKPNAACVVQAVQAAKFRASPGVQFPIRFLIRPLSPRIAMAHVGMPNHLEHDAPQAPATVKAPKVVKPLPTVKQADEVSNDPLAGLKVKAIEGKKTVP
jgi:hypothetical protein